MLRKNARLFGYLLVLALVVLMMAYLDRASRAPAPAVNPDNLPELGHVPSPEQVHGSAPPPKKRK